jgi:hypothetical protein
MNKEKKGKKIYKESRCNDQERAETKTRPTETLYIGMYG